MTKIKFNVNGIKIAFKMMKLCFNKVGFHILIEFDLTVTGSQFGFPGIKFDVWRSKFHLCQIEGVGPF